VLNKEKQMLKRPRASGSPFLKGHQMKSTVGSRKAAESAKGLKAGQKELKRQDTESHVRDISRIDKGDSHKPIRVVGGLENLNSHNTEYHKKMKRGETATNAGKPKTRTLLQKQIAANPTLFDKE
jgi:hypothetical protein